MDPFELSLSPYFNDVIRAASIVHADPTQEENCQELSAAIKVMVDFAQVLAGSFYDAMKVRPNTQLSQTAPISFEKSLRTMGDALRDINDFMNPPNDEDKLFEALEQGRNSIIAMFAIFEDMKREEESFPVFSESPYIQELVRVATGVAKGEYNPETLKDKLQWMTERYQEFAKDFDNLCQSPRENDEVDKLLPVAKKALSRMGAALGLMNEYMKKRDRNLLKSGCADLLQASEVLIAVQDRLMKVSTAQPAACPKCGKINPPAVKTCCECGAAMPEIVGLAKQTMEVKEGNEPKPTFEFLARIESAVEARLNDMISDEELKKHIEFFALKARNGRRDFEAMKVPQNINDEEAKEIAYATHSLMDEATSETVKGVELLERFLSSQEKEDLRQGMEKINIGVSKILESHTLAQG